MSVEKSVTWAGEVVSLLSIEDYVKKCSWLEACFRMGFVSKRAVTNSQEGVLPNIVTREKPIIEPPLAYIPDLGARRRRAFGRYIVDFKGHNSCGCGTPPQQHNKPAKHIDIPA